MDVYPGRCGLRDPAGSFGIFGRVLSSELLQLRGFFCQFSLVPILDASRSRPQGTSGNLRAGEQWAGRVCSVICQVYTKIFVPVKTVPISDAAVVVPRVLCLGRPCAGLHRGRLAQSAPVGVLSSALVVSKALPLSPNILAALQTSQKIDLSAVLVYDAGHRTCDKQRQERSPRICDFSEQLTCWRLVSLS